MTVGVGVREWVGGGGGGGVAIMKISPAKINSLLWIEKAAILPVVLAASKRFFFEANVVHSQPGIPVNARA